jgi:hypothetical protein
MARLRSQLRFRRKVRLTSEEFASLQEVATGPMQRTIPDEHQDRLIAAGYIRELMRPSRVILVLTGAGMRRLESGQ